MKLTTKLLPVATLGAVASVVVPLATSCGSSAGWLDARVEVKTDGWKKAAGKKVSTDAEKLTATIDYMKAISEDSTIAEKDFMWTGNKFFNQLADLLDKLAPDPKRPDDFGITYKFNSFKTKLANLSLTEQKKDNDTYYLVSFDNGIQFDTTIDVKGKAEISIIPGIIEFPFELDGKIHISTNITAKYKNVLGEMDFKNESIAGTIDPEKDPEAAFLAIIISAITGGEENYVDTTFRANLLKTIDPKGHGFDIETPDWAYGFKGSLDISYVNSNDNSLNLDLHFDGSKNYTKADIEKTQWDEDLLTDLSMVLTGQWYTFYYADVVAPEVQPEP